MLDSYQRSNVTEQLPEQRWHKLKLVMDFLQVQWRINSVRLALLVILGLIIVMIAGIIVGYLAAVLNLIRI